jgi:glycosyltransferase involved in cell wall biosynthesis
MNQIFAYSSATRTIARAAAMPKRIAIIHYWLVGMRGGERVLERLLRLFPTADIFTHVYVPSAVSPLIRSRPVTTSFIQHLPGAARHYQKYLPLMPIALEQLDLRGYDLVISSESGPAKGVIAAPDATHICYCHSPMRYLWDHYHDYRDSSGLATRIVMPWAFHRMRQWDVSSAARVDSFVANSSFIQRRIQRVWSRKSEVVHPPVQVDLFTPTRDVEDHYLWVGQLIRYKRPDIAVEAFNRLGLPLLMIGEGELSDGLKARARSNVRIVPHLPFSELRKAYARCRALVFTAEEDFGIVPVEAMAAGRPVLAYAGGGTRDTVVPGETGLLFSPQTTSGLIEGVEAMEAWLPDFNPDAAVAQASRFSPEKFDVIRMAAAAFALLTATLLAGSSPVTDVSPVPLRIGVATHFDQGWALDLLGRVVDFRLGAIRDDLPWGKGEPEPRRYDFSGPSAAYVAQACARGIKVLAMISPHHPAYDGNVTVYSPLAQQAYAEYLNAVLDRFGTGCIDAIEVGNEINAGDPQLPDGVSSAGAHASLLRRIAAVVKPRHPDVKILGGSSNMVATGFEEELFSEGALDYVDGIVVHPYRDHPEGLEIELPRLRAAMRRHGQPRPIWATETGDEVDDPRASASLLLRMLCLIAGEPDVASMYWYALIDERYYRNTGLLDDRIRMKPAGEAMLAATRFLLPGGRPVRINAGDRRSYLYRFGKGNYVAWGVPRRVKASGDARFFDAQGRPLSGPIETGSDPIIIVGAEQVELDAGPVMADSLYQYGGDPWSYLARRSSGETVPLRMIDWTWTSYWGQPDFRPLEIGAGSAIPAGDGGNPLAATVRFTAPATTAASISACFTKTARGDGVTIEVFHNDRPIYAASLTDRLVLPPLPVTMNARDTLDFAFGPRRTSESDALTYRIRILARDAGAGAQAPCA